MIKKIFIIILLLTSSFTWSITTLEKVELNYTKAQLAVNNGEFVEALKLLENNLIFAPKHLESFFLLVRIVRSKKGLDEAILLMEKRRSSFDLNSDPKSNLDNLKFDQELARLKYDRFEKDGAHSDKIIDLLLTLIKNNYQVISNRFLLGRVYLKDKSFSLALNEFLYIEEHSSLSERSPYLNQVKTFLAICLWNLGYTDLAANNFSDVSNFTESSNPYKQVANKSLIGLGATNKTINLSLTQLLESNPLALNKNLEEQRDNSNSHSNRQFSLGHSYKNNSFKTYTNFSFNKYEAQKFKLLDSMTFYSNSDYTKQLKGLHKFGARYTFIHSLINTINNQETFEDEYRSYSTTHVASPYYLFGMKKGKIEISLPISINNYNRLNQQDSKVFLLTSTFSLLPLNQFLTPSFRFSLGQEKGELSSNDEDLLKAQVANSFQLRGRYFFNQSISYDNAKLINGDSETTVSLNASITFVIPKLKSSYITTSFSSIKNSFDTSPDIKRNIFAFTFTKGFSL